MESQSFFSKNYVQVLLTLILVGVLAALAAYTHLTLKQAKGAFSGEASITVVGEGEVLAKPDIGVFSFSVMAEGEDAASAQESSAQAVNDILSFLDDSGVAEEDIKTENYNLNPKYRYEERVCVAGGYCPPGERVIDGYEVYQTVSVKVRELDESGSLISGVGERGATNISGLSFTIDDEDELMAEARAQAIKDAKEKAEVLADNLDMRLGRIVGFWEDNNDYYGSPMMGMGGAEMDTASSMIKTSPSLPTGENNITARVNIHFELK